MSAQHVKTGLLAVAFAFIGLAGCAQQQTQQAETEASAQQTTETFEVSKTEKEWKEQLTKQQFYVLRQQGTERAFTGAYYNNHEQGTYTCAGCGQVLFNSSEKFDSGTGWPSFWDPANKTCVASESDMSHGMVRTEVHCSRCGGHLGHVFDDGPAPTGLRYCINSVSLNFEPKPSTDAENHE